jgi:hypothetical protein
MESGRCAVCGKDTQFTCTWCKTTYYCSSSCRKKDNSFHFLLCLKLKHWLENRPDHLDPPRRDPEEPYPEDPRHFQGLGHFYIVGLLFPEKTNRPEFIWLKVHTTTNWNVKDWDGAPDHECYHTVEMVTDLTGLMKSPKSHYYTRHGREIEYYMGLQTFVHKEHETFSFLNAGYDSTNMPAGNIVVASVVRENRPHANGIGTYESIQYRDITLADYRSAFTKFTELNRLFEGERINRFYIKEEKMWHKAVIISCRADVEILGKKKYRQVDIHRRHHIHSKEQASKSPLAYLMDIPLLCKVIPPNKSWGKYISAQEEAYLSENDDALSLMVNAEILDHEWGTQVEGWEHGPSHTILVARYDKKDVSHHQVEALVSYFQNVVRGGMRSASDIISGEKSTKAREQLIEILFHSRQFEIYLEGLKEDKIKDGDMDWVNVVSPRDGWTGRFKLPQKGKVYIDGPGI